MKKCNILFLVMLLMFLLVGCNETIPFNGEYSVTYETNGGNELANDTFTAGETLILPEEPLKENAKFVGWYTDADFENKFDASQSLPAEDITLYAKWNVKISFVTNNSTELLSMNKECGDLVILPRAKASLGTQFAGWYYDKEFNNAAENIYSVGNDPVTFYGRWNCVEEGTTIDLLSNLTVNQAEHYNILKEENGVKVSTTPSKSTWSFLYSPIENNMKDYETIQLTFKGSKNQSFVAKLEGGGVSAIETKIVLTGEEQCVYWEVPQENIAQNPGQRLLIFLDGGANGSLTPTEILFTDISFVKMIPSDLNGEEALIFNSMGGNQLEILTAPLNSDIILPENPTKAGYDFDGWYKDANLTEKFNETKMPKGPTILYAKWVEATEHKVSFVTNCDVVLESIFVREGLTFETPKLVVAGWSFDGWYTDGSLTQKAELVMGTSDITLYAKWTTLEELSNKETAMNLGKGWKVLETGTYTVSESANSLSITATTNKKESSYVYRELNGLDLKQANALHLVFNGKIGDSFTIKYNNSVEITIEITEAHQEEWIYLETAINSDNLILYYEPNATISADTTITFEKFEVLNPIVLEIRESILKGWFSNEAEKYEVIENTNSTVISANPGKSAWSFAKINLGTYAGLDLKNIQTIELTFTGETGHSFIIKYNNRKEQKVVLTGEEQSLILKLEEKIDLSINNHLIMFIDGGVVPTEKVSITFTKMELSGKVEDTSNGGNVGGGETLSSVDIKKGWFEADKGSYNFNETEESTTITATTGKKSWSVAKLIVSDMNVGGATGARLVLQGPAGHTVIFKYNNKKEQKITLDGTVQELVVDFTIDFDTSKPLYIFIDGGKTLTEEVSVTFTTIELLFE